jgi:hypothetical protein
MEGIEMERKISMPDDDEPVRDRDGDHYRTVFRTDDLVLLQRVEGVEDLEEPERVLMAGEVLDTHTLLEVINVIASSRWAGTLHIHSDDAHRILGFGRGVLRYARSDHPEDRLDKVLVRAGSIKPSRLEGVMRSIRPDQRLGELLVEEGLLERRQLFSSLREQMQQVLLSAVLVTEGCFAFIVSSHDDMPPDATAHIPLPQLLLDAAERVDRLSYYQRLVPSVDLRPEVESGVVVTHLNPHARLVLGYCDGERSVREIASESWLGRFETVATVYDLVREKRIRLLPPRRTPEQTARELVAPFNETLRDIYRTVDRFGDTERVHQELKAWVLEDSDRRVLAEALNGSGLISSEPVAASLSTAGTRHHREELEDTLHELVTFALFSASLPLPREEERDLARRVQKRLRPEEPEA